MTGPLTSATEVVATKADLRSRLEAERAARRSVGFVPTMGALHDGHLSLVARARAECDVCVVSIFVNPAQFGPNEDLAAYPRPLDRDLRLCRDEGVDVVFVPDAAEVYPRPPRTTVRVDGLTARMEGAHRPGHFDGVCLVVTKLVGMVGPCRAYFGAKDAQQLRVVRAMAADLDLPATIVECPTVREADGLALSSRNAYLSMAERHRAAFLSRALFAVRDLCAQGQMDVERLLARGRAVLSEGSPDGVDYIECVAPDTLEPVQTVLGAALVCAAVRIGSTRLIDNVMVGTTHTKDEE